MTNRPDLSVIIPMHNASATVTGVVESFLEIDAAAVEVIVVDDASTDDSVERVTALGRPEVIVERFETNRGAGVARNHGFERATGRYTLFFDADDEIHPVTLTVGDRGARRHRRRRRDDAVPLSPRPLAAVGGDELLRRHRRGGSTQRHRVG